MNANEAPPFDQDTFFTYKKVLWHDVVKRVTTRRGDGYNIAQYE